MQCCISPKLILNRLWVSTFSADYHNQSFNNIFLNFLFCLCQERVRERISPNLSRSGVKFHFKFQRNKHASRRRCAWLWKQCQIIIINKNLENQHFYDTEPVILVCGIIWTCFGETPPGTVLPPVWLSLNLVQFSRNTSVRTFRAAGLLRLFS